MKPGFSPAIFLAGFCVVYAVVFALDFPLFRYYPLHGDFNWGSGVLKGVGPAITWYGLMAYAGLGAGVFAVAIPDRLATRALRDLVWLFPVAAMLVCAFLLRHLFA